MRPIWRDASRWRFAAVSTEPPRSNRASRRPETLAAQGGGEVDPRTRAIVPAIHPSTTFERDPDGEYSSGNAYSRPHNPSYSEPESILAQLEGGEECLLFSSGMAAATAVFQALAPGDHVVVPKVMYWALRKWLSEFAMTWGLQVELVDTTDPAAVAQALRPGQTRILWLDTPANPTWELSDIEQCAALAHAAHARLVVDSTVATPVLCKPLAFGADIVVHSATKYLNGHSDVLAGALICNRIDAYWHRIRAWRRDGGAVLGSFEAWLLLRGMRTLFIRVAHSSQTALQIARWLATRSEVLEVLYPGLETHPQHELACRQLEGGFGGMLSFRHRFGEAAAVATAAAVQVFKRATSLGGVESLIEHRASIEGPTTPVPQDLLRLSIGLEHVDDLIADLAQALDSVAGAPIAPTPPSASRAGGNSEQGSIEPRLRGYREALEREVQPLLRERGGDLSLLEIDAARIARVQLHGSPGAVIPVLDSVRSSLARQSADIRGVVPLGMHRERAPADTTSQATQIEQQLRAWLQQAVNPAIAEHGGKIELVRYAEGWAFVEMTGRCQGCAMAEVTLRHGVEAMARQVFDELLGIVDLTEHQAGEDPYFKTRKNA